MNIKSQYKMLNSAFNAQVSRVIIIVVQVAVKIYVAATEALRIKERQDESQFATKFGGKSRDWV
jgi:predicted oxidoreductase (fatty acid repression mutant protein)